MVPASPRQAPATEITRRQNKYCKILRRPSFSSSFPPHNIAKMNNLLSNLNVLGLGSSEPEKSSAEAAPSGVEFRPAVLFGASTSGSSEAQKSSAEATPSGVSNTTSTPATTTTTSTTAATTPSENGGKTKAKAKESRSGAGRAPKPPRQKCPHCGKWGGHRPDQCWSRPVGPTHVNNITVQAGASVFAAGAVTSGRVTKPKPKKKKKGGKTSEGQ